MDDTGKTSRFRCKKWLINTFYGIIVILPIITGLACWFSYESWQSMRLWKQEKAQFEQALNESKIKIQSLEHLQTLLQSNLQPAFVKQKKLPITKDRASLPKAITSVEPAPLKSATPVLPSMDKVDLSIYKEPLDDQRIRLDNVQARIVNKSDMRIKSDIFNAESSKVLAGTIAFSILLPNGDIKALRVKDSSFRIRRYRRIINTTRLGKDVLQNINNSLLIAEVYVDKQLSYRNYYPIKTR